MSRVRDSVRFAVLACLPILGPASGEAQQDVRQVLVLQSFDRGNLQLDHFTANLRVDLDQRVGTPVNFVQVVVGPTGFVGASEQAIVDFILSAFANRPNPNLIVTAAGPAATFARQYRNELFPDTPLLLAAVDRRYVDDAPSGDNETAVAVDMNISGVVDEILQLLPETQQVFVILGSGVTGRFWRPELEDEFKRFHDRLAFIWSDDLSLQEILRRSARLPENSAILFISFGTDASGAAYADERVVADLYDSANAPLFAAHDVYFGSGIVGGSLIAIDDLARNAADAAVRILNGEPPRRVSVPPQPPSAPIFDWRELRRWSIPESRLPPGSVVHYRGPTLWNEYRGTVLVGAALVAFQATLILGLLLERRARRRAEIDSRRNLALATDVNRRETMSALTTSIGHELTQPLSAIMYNAQALQMMAAAKGATPEAIREILSDIQTDGLRAAQIIDRHRAMLRGHQLQERPIDLRDVLTESLAFVAQDMLARQIALTVNLPSSPCVINGDPVLLQQVIVNLVMNATDAMAETPPARRRVIINVSATPKDVELCVRDTGPGLPADIVDQLFAPFVTTKSHGLGIGLTIARRIVDAHRGTIAADNSTEGGATFKITLPRSASDLPLRTASES